MVRADPPGAPAQLAALLGGAALFSRLSPPQLRALAGTTREVRLGRGQPLFHAGDVPDALYLLLSGQVKLYVVGPSGTEKVIEVVTAGETFAEALLFGDRVSPVTAVALIPSRLLAVGRDAITTLLADDAAFARRLLAGMAQRLHTLVRDLASLSLRSGIQRLVGYLLHEVADGGDGAAVVRIPVSKGTLASRLSLTPETLSRALRELVDARLIAVQGRCIVIADPDRLRRYAELPRGHAHR